MSRLVLLGALLAAPAWAQSHQGHDAHAGHQMTQPVGEPQAEPVDPSPGPTMELPPPEEVGSGPPRAADAIWGAEAMAPSRVALKREHGSTVTTWLQADRRRGKAGRVPPGFKADAFESRRALGTMACCGICRAITAPRPASSG